MFLSGITFAFIEAPALGWLSPAVLAAVLLGGAGLALFLARERHAAAPMLPLTIIMLALSARSGELAARTGPWLQLTAGPSSSAPAWPCSRSGIASAVNNDVARFGGLLAVAVLPSLAAITGGAYLHPDALAAGFRTAVLISGALCAAVPDQCLHCGRDAPPLTTSVSPRE